MHYAFYDGSCKQLSDPPGSSRFPDRPPTDLVDAAKTSTRASYTAIIQRAAADYSLTINLLQEVEHCPAKSRYTPRTPKCTMHYHFAAVQLMAD